MDAVTRRKPADDPDDSSEAPNVKRRKVRRGTRSCWECKRRKMKCVFERPDDAICIGCHRRWSKCVSQEFPEEASAPSLDSNDRLRERLRCVEARLSHVLTQVGAPDAGILTPASPEYQPAVPLRDDTPGTSSAATIRLEKGKYDGLARTLWEALPSQDDTRRIAKASAHNSVPVHEILTTPYVMLDQDGLRPQRRLMEIPGPNAHPVLLARHMLYLASFLQHLHPSLHEEVSGLSEPPKLMKERLVELVSSLVTSSDRFVDCVEFLECVMIESQYQANCGLLRCSWMTARRAMVIAQGMGLPRPTGCLQYKTLTPDTKTDPHFLWFRIVFYDRQMCLLLGLPQGTLDRSMADEATLAGESPGGRLERLHCVIASRVLERNESSFGCWDYALTQALEQDLRSAAQGMPSRWWLMPHLRSEKNDPQELFWEMRRLSEQLCHYNLLNQLHLPYMLHRSIECQHEHSRIVCVNASREVLSRFIMLHRWNRGAFSCRTMDFTAVMAAITLLLAHLASRRSPEKGNFLNIQYPGDRAIIEQAQDNMEDLNRISRDPLNARSAALLRRLLAIDTQAAEGNPRSAHSVSVQAPDTDLAPVDESASGDKSVYIPYFGVVKAVVEAQSCDQDTTARATSPENSGGQQPAEGIRPVLNEGAMSHSVTPGLPASSLWPSSVNGITTFAPLFPEVFSAESLQIPDPEETSGFEETSWQDVDLTFLNDFLTGVGQGEE
ncbi:uncharacterized protein KD926_006019 [Aspergillus affinis]|uniref:uncharacterized protein n=1 Tax=Aspergillus affinis TaxID=1070780 RepID=UPI0022FE8FF1|nr:uncharacterized protein KD926_006019 [Aspergillus affinis]KAI9046072.1 hypothetical protein KD926_006019 [Aspergillus affinis]